MSNRVFIPTNRIPSNFEIVSASLGVKVRKPKHWSLQQRVPGLISQDRQIKEIQERCKEIKNDSLEKLWPNRREGVKQNVLLVKKVKSLYRPIGVGAINRGFKTIQAVRVFARSIGKTHVRQGAIFTSVGN